MLFYFRYTFALLLICCNFVHAQKDSSGLNTKHPKFEIGVAPITLYLLPSYFINKNVILLVSGLEFKYYANTKNAIRLAFTFNNSSKGVIPIGASQYEYNQKTKQFSLGFQHSFINLKKIDVYSFADLYYQTFQVNSSTVYTNFHNSSGYVQTSYDSTTFLSQGVNSFNLVVGVGVKFVERKHVFISVESGLSLSYYTGTQETHGSAAASYSNVYISSSGSQQTLGQGWNTYHQLPIVDTKTKGVNLNGSIIRIALGVVF